MGDVAVCSIWWCLIWFTESLSWNKWEQREREKKMFREKIQPESMLVYGRKRLKS